MASHFATVSLFIPRETMGATLTLTQVFAMPHTRGPLSQDSAQ